MEIYSSLLGDCHVQVNGNFSAFPLLSLVASLHCHVGFHVSAYKCDGISNNDTVIYILFYINDSINNKTTHNCLIYKAIKIYNICLRKPAFYR